MAFQERWPLFGGGGGSSVVFCCISASEIWLEDKTNGICWEQPYKRGTPILKSCAILPNLV